MSNVSFYKKNKATGAFDERNPFLRIGRVLSAPHDINLNLLKFVAMLSMVIDHIHLIWFHRRGVGFDGIYSPLLTKIGLLALPLFCFILTFNLMHHTSSKTKLLKRLFLFGVVSQYPYYWSLKDHVTFNGLNIFATLLLGALLVSSAIHYKKPSTGWIASLGCTVVLVFEHSTHTKYSAMLDGGLTTVVLMLALFLAMQPKWYFMMLGWLFSSIALYILDGQLFYWPLAGILFATYFSRWIPLKMKWMQKSKWFFYGFYPAHLALIQALLLWRRAFQ
tara:strand:+ start:812 stop:1642 length:831 start_codon:yes stop_codon:yes gene_type:complete